MKRAIGLIFLIAAVVLGFLSIRGVMPFIPIFGPSMEPTLESGTLLIIEPKNPADIEIGDIIVFNVPSSVRDFYNYPPVVAHRVIKITEEPILSFRTAGDNTGEDPFATRAANIQGTVGNQIPYLGIPLLFFQSQQGMIFTIIALALLVFFLYSEELTTGQRRLHNMAFSPVIQATQRSSRVLTDRIENTEQKIDLTQDALLKFSGAIEEYAKHLASHTSAIQGLAEASHELKRSAAEQNRVLMNLVENMGQQPRYEQQPAPPQQSPEQLITRVEKAISDLDEKLPDVRYIEGPPGCARKPQNPDEEGFRKHHPNT